MSIVNQEIIRAVGAIRAAGVHYVDEIRLTNDEFFWLLDSLTPGFRYSARLSTATYAGMKVIVDDSVAGIPFVDRIRRCPT